MIYLCGDCGLYLKKGKCPRAIYRSQENNRAACQRGDKMCYEFQLKKVYPKRFDGDAYDPELDRVRLTGQILRIFNLMVDGVWRTLSEIERLTGDPQASISAQLRHLRKKRFGSYIINKQRRGLKTRGLWEYKLLK